MEQIILIIGMAAAFILGAKVKDFRLPRIRRKPEQPNEQKRHEDIIEAQMRELMGYTENDYGKRDE